MLRGNDTAFRAQLEQELVKQDEGSALAESFKEPIHLPRGVTRVSLIPVTRESGNRADVRGKSSDDYGTLV